ncbi:MAG TPA: ABC transporter permease [Acidobacteriaceae bacterium]|jgi:predicted permease|nr:ABC transporter permease [Acidobacteriaceae bacterium]
MLRNVKSGIRALLRRDERNAEIDEEVRSFVEASVTEKMQRGASREEAVRAARAEVGSTETVRHKVWSAGWESAAESVGQDIRSGVRQMVRSPGFSAVAIVSLALGIGANTAIFTLINDLLLKQLPVRDPQQLLSFGDGSSSGTIESSGPGAYDIFPYEFYRRIENQQQFEGVSAFSSFPTMVSVRSGQGAAGPATQAMSHLVSGTFFSVLGAEPLLGHTFRAEDTAVAGGNPVAVISHRYWQQELAADPGVIGRRLTINGTAFTVIGVMRPGFYGVDLNEQSPDMWLPITMQPEVTLRPTLLNPDGMFWIHMMARRKPGVPTAQAQTWVTEQFRRFLVDRAGGAITQDRRRQIAGTFIPLLPGGAGLSHIRRSFETPLAVLMGMVGIVLLIACANLANLLLAKAAAREREFTTRLALGSSRGRIVRQILTETLVLAFAGGVLGLGMAFWVTRALIHFISQGAAHTALAATPDLRVLGFTSGICLLTGVLFGIAPAWRSSRIRAIGALNAQARTATGGGGGRGGRMLPRTLVVAQVALSLVLLTVAGLLLRTLHNLRSQNLGFNQTNLLLVTTNPKFAGYQPAQLDALYARILDRVGTLPGVRSATMSGAPPMSEGSWNSPIYIEGRAVDPHEDVSTLLNRVAPRYFETVGIPLLRGRTIGAEDTASAQKAVVVNQTLAERYFPRGDAIGHTFTVADPDVKGTWQIVGIVGNAKFNSPAEKPQPMAYLAVMQLTGDDQYAYFLQVQTVGDPAKVTGEVRNALAGIDPNLPVLDVSTMTEQVDRTIDVPTLVSQLAGFFALLALSLACVGLYGVMSYNVVRRTSEIGVRMALGAARGRVLWLVLQESLVLLAIGVGLGVPAGLAASHGIRAGLFEVSPTDPMTVAAAVALVTAVICGAAWLPARRATRIDPMAALRQD